MLEPNTSLTPSRLKLETSPVPTKSMNSYLILQRLSFSTIVASFFHQAIRMSIYRNPLSSNVISIHKKGRWSSQVVRFFDQKSGIAYLVKGPKALTTESIQSYRDYKSCASQLTNIKITSKGYLMTSIKTQRRL